MMRTPDLDQLEPIERASRDELAALQLKRLKRVIRHAYDNVPLYREKSYSPRPFSVDWQSCAQH